MPFTDIHARLGSHSHAIGLMHRISTDLDKPQLPGRTPTLFIKMMLSSQATVLQLNCHPKDLRSFGDPVILARHPTVTPKSLRLFGDPEALLRGYCSLFNHPWFLLGSKSPLQHRVLPALRLY